MIRSILNSIFGRWYKLLATAEREGFKKMRKAIVTNTYLLQKNEEDKKGFGYVQGFCYLPDYETKIKVYTRNDRLEAGCDIDNMNLLTLESAELESINKAAQFIDNSLKTLISLAKRDLLKDEFFIDREEP